MLPAIFGHTQAHTFLSEINDRLNQWNPAQLMNSGLLGLGVGTILGVIFSTLSSGLSYLAFVLLAQRMTYPYGEIPFSLIKEGGNTLPPSVQAPPNYLTVILSGLPADLLRLLLTITNPVDRFVRISKNPCKPAPPQFQ